MGMIWTGLGSRALAVLVLGLLGSAGLGHAQDRAQNKSVPDGSVEAAVAAIIQRLNPAQRSIVQGTPKDNLFMLQGEWGEDIEELLGLEQGNQALKAAVCAAVCTSDQATFLLMQKAWEVLQRK
jgi:hypothetical protein